MRLSSLIVVCFVVGGGFQVHAEETPHFNFVTEYIRELAAIENIRASVEKQLNQDTADEKIAESIHASTLIQLELRSQIAILAILKGMQLNSPLFDTLIPSLIKFYEHKIVLHQKMIDVSSAFMAGPEPDVDYGKLAVEMPKIRAELDYVDHTLFEATPLVFGTLIDQKPDSKNHLSHLVVTKEERKKLISDIDASFGLKLNEKNQNWTVSSATVLKAYLLKDFRCSDEPWE